MDLRLIFWTRSFAPDASTGKISTTTSLSGLGCERESGKLMLCGNLLSFVENRCSLAAHAIPFAQRRRKHQRLYPYGVCGIIYIHDPDTTVEADPTASGYFQPRWISPHKDIAWTATQGRLASCGCFSGISEFQKALCVAMDDWYVLLFLYFAAQLR